MASLPRSARLFRALFVASCLVPLLQACGRSDPGDYLYNSDGTIAEGATASTFAGRSSTTGGTRNSRAGASATGATGPTGGTGSVGFGGASTTGGTGIIPRGGTTSVAGSIGVGAVGGIGMAGSIGMGGSIGTAGAAGAPAQMITCGGQICDPSTEACCASLAGLVCIGQNQACGGAVLGCTLNSDCSGNDVCCISVTGNANEASSCKATCDRRGPGRDRQLCQSNAECQTQPFTACTATVFGVSICTVPPRP